MRGAADTQPPFAAPTFANQLEEATTSAEAVEPEPVATQDASPAPEDESPPAPAAEATTAPAAEAAPTPAAEAAPAPAAEVVSEAAPEVSARASKTRSAPSRRARSSKRSSIVGRRSAAGRDPELAVPRPEAPPRKLDDGVVAMGLHELTDLGVGEAWARELVALGAAHHKSFSDGNLREGVVASIAASLPVPAPLPAAGAAVAIVGAGGAGKTRAAAALASAYGRGSTLPVTVVALGSRDAGAEIRELLREEENVHVTAAPDADRAAMAVSTDRADGLVVIDTAAARPREAATVAALGRELEALAPDAVYIVVPATLSARVGATLLESFAPLSPTGIVIGHADETDHFGVVAQLSHDSGIPIAYIHDGLDLDCALRVADPLTLARRLLP